MAVAALEATCCRKRSKRASGREYFTSAGMPRKKRSDWGIGTWDRSIVLLGVLRENGPETATLTSARRAALRILGGLSSAYFVVSEDGSPTMSATCRAACRQSSADSAVAYDTLEGR